MTEMSKLPLITQILLAFQHNYDVTPMAYVTKYEVEHVFKRVYLRHK